MMTHGSSSQRGSALLMTVLLVLIFSMLGGTALHLAGHELEGGRAVREQLVAQQLTESAAQVVVRWFHDTAALPPALAARFQPRLEDGSGRPSHFDAEGRSQFTGTATAPDLLLDAARPEDDLLMNDPGRGWFRSLRGLGRLLRLKVYGPARPGLLCTVEVTAAAGELQQTAALQLGARRIPALRSGVQLRTGIVAPSVAPAPVWLHWGDLTIKGDVLLGRRSDIPTKTELTGVGERSYRDMPRWEDRWLDVWIGGQAIVTASGTDGSVPPHVHPMRDPVPGLRTDQWEYELLKEQALTSGTYYVPDREGRLYRNGIIVPGLGLSPSAVLASTGPDDHHGLVFIDTLDQRPPRGDNLARLRLDAPYSEGVFVINAHLDWRPSGAGEVVPALSPPPEGQSALAARVPVLLTGIHHRGVLYVSGDLSYEGAPKVYGGVVVEGQLLQARSEDGNLEVWYNHELSRGLFQGMPVVFIAPGTWTQWY